MFNFHGKNKIYWECVCVYVEDSTKSTLLPHIWQTIIQKQTYVKKNQSLV